MRTNKLAINSIGILYIFRLSIFFIKIICSSMRRKYPMAVVYPAAMYPKTGIKIKFKTIFIEAARIEATAIRMVFL